MGGSTILKVHLHRFGCKNKKLKTVYKTLCSSRGISACFFKTFYIDVAVVFVVLPPSGLCGGAAALC